MKLLKGEKIDSALFSGKGDFRLRDDEINEKYRKGEVRIVTEQARYPLNTIYEMFKTEKYKLQPEFQRRNRWDAARKSKLIESFIINIPIPPIFLYEVEYSKYEVMDGLQRVSTIIDFYNDGFALEGLEEWSELNGYTYSKLPQLIRYGIDRRYLSSIILLQESARDEAEETRMKQMVFERLNNGGVDLSPQETRNALFDGKLNQLCIILSKNKHFRELWSIPVNIEIAKQDNKITENNLYDRMEDVELILRFFAFRQIEKFDSNYLNRFLDAFLINGNKFNETLLLEYTQIFEKTIDLIYETLGKSAFCLYRKKRGSNELIIRKTPSRVLYDPLMFVFCQYLEKAEILIEKSTEIKIAIKNLFASDYDLFVSRFNKNDIVKRNSAMKDIVCNILGD